MSLPSWRCRGIPMQIEIYTPPPASPSPPEPPRKKRPGLVLAALFVVSFVVSLAVLCWDRFTGSTEHDATTAEAPAVPLPAGPAQSPAAPSLTVLEKRKLSQ